jgi:hypothetical protein
MTHKTTAYASKTKPFSLNLIKSYIDLLPPPYARDSFFKIALAYFSALFFIYGIC